MFENAIQVFPISYKSALPPKLPILKIKSTFKFKLGISIAWYLVAIILQAHRIFFRFNVSQLSQPKCNESLPRRNEKA